MGPTKSFSLLVQGTEQDFFLMEKKKVSQVHTVGFGGVLVGI